MGSTSLRANLIVDPLTASNVTVSVSVGAHKQRDEHRARNLEERSRERRTMMASTSRPHHDLTVSDAVRENRGESVNAKRVADEQEDGESRTSPRPMSAPPSSSNASSVLAHAATTTAATTRMSDSTSAHDMLDSKRLRRLSERPLDREPRGRKSQDGVDDEGAGDVQGAAAQRLAASRRQRRATSTGTISAPRRAQQRPSSSTAASMPCTWKDAPRMASSKAATVSEWYTVRREWSMDRGAYLIVAKPDHYRLVAPRRQLQTATPISKPSPAPAKLAMPGSVVGAGRPVLREHRGVGGGRAHAEQMVKEGKSSPSPRPYSAPAEGLGKRERVAWSSMPQASRLIRIKCRPCSGRGERRLDAPWRRHHVRQPEAVR